MARRVSEKRLRESLQEHGGNVALVADAYGVARQTIYNWVSEYGLRDEITLARETMFMTAERNINLAVQAGNIDASKFVLTHMPVAERWSSKSEVALDLLPPDVVEMLRQEGVDVKQVLQEFAAMVREQKAAPAALPEQPGETP